MKIFSPNLYFRKRSKRLNENATREETKKSFRANRVGKFNRDCPGKKKESRLIIHGCMRPDNVGMRANKKFDSQKRVHRQVRTINH